MEVYYVVAQISNSLDVRYKKIIFSAKTTTEVWNVAPGVPSGTSFQIFDKHETGGRVVGVSWKRIADIS